MQRCSLTYCVEPSGDGWTVMYCSAPHGRYPNRPAALRAAVFDADRVQKMGHVVTILVARPGTVVGLPKRRLHRALLADHPPVFEVPRGKRGLFKTRASNHGAASGSTRPTTHAPH